MAKKKTTTKKTNVNKDEQIGIHKGSLSTLAKERQELGRLLQIVEQLMQMHIAALKELGVDLEAQAKAAMKKSAKVKGKKGAIEEML
ncbi:hypothetical protein KY336_01335 [Candidatus Woesearchaeota archaeon]|nr:hypothetical protein [Candidatus Woesearchaeota archaeon]